MFRPKTALIYLDFIEITSCSGRLHFDFRSWKTGANKSTTSYEANILDIKDSSIRSIEIGCGLGPHFPQFVVPFDRRDWFFSPTAER